MIHFAKNVDTVIRKALKSKKGLGRLYICQCKKQWKMAISLHDDLVALGQMVITLHAETPRERVVAARDLVVKLVLEEQIKDLSAWNCFVKELQREVKLLNARGLLHGEGEASC